MTQVTNPAPNQAYWLVGSNGGIYSNGAGVQFDGTAASLPLSHPIVGMAVGPFGFGYWLVASDGGIFSYGDARFYGSTGTASTNQSSEWLRPPTAGLLAGRFRRGNLLLRRRQLYGSTGDVGLNEPIVAWLPPLTARAIGWSLPTGAFSPMGTPSSLAPPASVQTAILPDRRNGEGLVRSTMQGAPVRRLEARYRAWLNGTSGTPVADPGIRS